MKLTNQQIAEQIVNPNFIEPEASMLFNLWSNLEYFDIYPSDPRYDRILDLATAIYPKLIHGEKTAS